MLIETREDQRFWSHVEKSESGCWLWTGSKSYSGYGRFMRAGGPPYRNAMTHRWIWERLRGPIPEGLFVCHHCDVPSCVNPDHLFLGKHRDNMRDARQKQRMKGSPGIALTEDDVILIRGICQRRLFTLEELAERFGVHVLTIWKAATGRSWRDV